MRFENKIAIVTGAALGIGQAAAQQLAAGGATVILTDINEETLQRTCEEIRSAGGCAEWMICDVSDEEQVRRMTAEVEERFGRIDILINNAGIWRIDRGPFVESCSEFWKKKVNVNILGSMYCAHAVLPGMLERRYGRIINISSVAGVYGIGNMTDYSMTKGAINGFTLALAKEVTEFGVTVNAVAPGNIITASHENNNVNLSFAGRSGSSEECANVICFLASDAASYVSGQVYQVDGCRKKM